MSTRYRLAAVGRHRDGVGYPPRMVNTRHSSVFRRTMSRTRARIVQFYDLLGNSAQAAWDAVF